MSAFICGPDHIKALAIFCVQDSDFGLNVDPGYNKYDGGKDLDRGSPKEKIASYYADALYQENIRSVSHRYSDDDFNSLPGPISKQKHMTVTRKDIADAEADKKNPVHRPVDILKMCDCIQYQSCETDDYYTTFAYKLLNRIRSAAIRRLPGYDAAPWDYYAEKHDAKVSV